MWLHPGRKRDSCSCDATFHLFAKIIVRNKQYDRISTKHIKPLRSRSAHNDRPLCNVFFLFPRNGFFRARMFFVDLRLFALLRCYHKHLTRRYVWNSLHLFTQFIARHEIYFNDISKEIKLRHDTKYNFQFLPIETNVRLHLAL